MTILTTLGATEFAILLFNLVLVCGTIGGQWYLLARLRRLMS
ncbi:hypothetical protein [Natrinema sp. HArc-T2]